jgi:hypothetical protein
MNPRDTKMMIGNTSLQVLEYQVPLYQHQLAFASVTAVMGNRSVKRKMQIIVVIANHSDNLNRNLSSFDINWLIVSSYSHRRKILITQFAILTLA